jgi:polynucleotide 5'-hydroxyl-kinase GRC3/NOL9
MEGSDQASAAGLYAGESPAIVISGAKLSGKNRFANFLMNQMSIMKKGVATFYLDLDVEKPEYTPQGQISLVRVRKLNMGPPYTHPIPIPGDENDNEIVWSHPMPLKGAAEYAEYYRSCIVDLIGRYNAIRSVHPKIALVINTPAFDIANGALSFLDTIGDINPTRLLYLGAPIRRKDACSISRIDRYCRKRGIYFETRAQDIKAVPLRSDNTLKELHMLSYFHCQGIEAASGERTYNTAPLSCMNPWQVYYGTSKPLDFIGVLVLGDWPGPDTITTILNGALVTIVETTDPATQALYDTLPRTPEDLSIRAHYGPDSNIPALMAGIPYFPPSASVVAPLDPANTRVVCNALIRGFDIDEQCLQILIPPSHDRLLMELDRRKTVLVAGCCEHPGWAYTEDPYVDYKENVHREDTEIRGGAWREGKDGVRLPPWVADAGEVEEWGKMNMVRRTRKFTSGR